ncbi:MAG: alpha/beta hydrolase [Acidobacteriota bacterium]
MRFLRPRRFNPPLREERWLRDGRPVALPFGATTLAAWMWGESGPTVLLAHGWEGRGSQMGGLGRWLSQEGFRAIAFDHPGHGKSPGRSSSLPEMADALLAAAFRFGPVSAVVAHSAGCAATTYALRRGLLAERLVYVSPPADLGYFAFQFGDMVGLSRPVAQRMRQRIETRLGITWPEIHGLDVAASCERPLLVIHDHDDREVGIDHGRELAQAWPGARFMATARRGHRRILRAPEVWTATAQFLVAGGTTVPLALEAS